VRLPADENFDVAIIQALRDAGHEVRAIRETNVAAPDEVVIQIAVSERRVLLTEDKGFGELVYNRAHPSAGVLLVRRFASPSPQAKPGAVVEAVTRLGEELVGKFVVVEPGRIRVGGRSPG
jgi:predicted nuclease of predicted toxin-antitoxin system